MISAKKIMTVSLVACAALMTGCQTNQGLYHWGEYETGLYNYYEDPAELTALSEHLLKSIENAKGNVAPGIYAEYGTLLLQQGKKDEAVVYYTKERDRWPESRYLMDAMIKTLTSDPEQKTQKDV